MQAPSWDTVPGDAPILAGQHAQRAPAAQQPRAAGLQARAPGQKYLLSNATAAPAHVERVLRGGRAALA